jgi:alpha-amylase
MYALFRCSANSADLQTNTGRRLTFGAKPCSGANYHRQRTMDWIDATGARSAAFDLTTKWQLQLAVERTEYWRMGCIPGGLGWWPAMSVTFIDNHDTGPSPDGGQNHWPFPGAKVEQGYAYILTHPGTPTVYWPHYFDWGPDLRGKIGTPSRSGSGRG